ncbi:MAG TPA: ABC transporter permease, partial [Prolixibacteraceae bacterium]|nr:ABC transporter permease [Prolixibacteraceae bacterium]
MTRLQLVWQSFRHYLRQNLLVVAGVAVSTAVLTGALIIGDSVRFSLEQSTFFRLGKTTQVVAAADRYFRSELAGAVAAETGFPVAPVLLLEGMAVADGGNLRVNRVQVTGVDERFEAIAGDTLLSRLADNEVVISENLAGQLQLKPGDNLMVRIRKASLVPMNAPFVSDAETSVTLRATVKAVAGKEQMGNFNLKNSQTAPFNLFLSLERLNRLMEFEGRANRLLLAAETLSSEQLLAALQKTVQPEDAGLQFKTIPLTGEREISTERVFLEAAVVKIFEQAPGARKVLTYFVNSLSLGEKETPYSFVSTLSNDELQPGEIVLNQWTASDLGARPGDTLLLRYFEIGPLR